MIHNLTIQLLENAMNGKIAVYLNVIKWGIWPLQERLGIVSHFIVNLIQIVSILEMYALLDFYLVLAILWSKEGLVNIILILQWQDVVRNSQKTRLGVVFRSTCQQIWYESISQGQIFETNTMVLIFRQKSGYVVAVSVDSHQFWSTDSISFACQGRL